MVFFGQDPEAPIDLRLLVGVKRIDFLKFPVQLKEDGWNAAISFTGAGCDRPDPVLPVVASSVGGRLRAASLIDFLSALYAK